MLKGKYGYDCTNCPANNGMGGCDDKNKDCEIRRIFDHGYSVGYAQRYVDMQEAGLEELIRLAEKYEKQYPVQFHSHFSKHIDLNKIREPKP